MLKTVVGHSDDPDTKMAIAEILDQCSERLAQIQPRAGILFAAIDFEYEIAIEEINRVFPGIDLIGCTTDGEVSSVLGFQQDSLTLILFATDGEMDGERDGNNVQIGIGLGKNVAQDPVMAAKTAISQATADMNQPIKLCITLPASYVTKDLTTSGKDILNALQSELGEHVPIIGGTAGDQFRFQNTYQFFQTGVFTNALPVLLFAGDIHCSYGIDCGWEPIGSKSIVTKSQGNTVYEIDEQPAIEFYRKYLGDRTPNAEHPLAVYEGDSDRYYMRVPNTVDRQTGAINFLAEVPAHSKIQITNISRNEVIQAAKNSFQAALQNYPGNQPEAVLIFSCCCRRWMLGTRTQEEYQLIHERIAEVIEHDISVCGFYTYGEFAPLELEGKSFFHQETFVTLVIGTK